MTPASRLSRIDPRLYQIATLSGLLVFGVVRLEFDVSLLGAGAILSAALLTQLVCTRLSGLPTFDPKSPLISALSLMLLLRSDSAMVLAAAAVLTIASKFVLRWNGKHLFNPTNFGLVVMLIVGAGWASPGQWGSAATFGFLIACLGGLVVNRAARSDVTYAFLASYAGLLFARALWLGQPFAIPLHQLQNGAFLIFTFFMISDPRTTPDSRLGRTLFAFLVAAVAVFIQFGLHRTNGLLWSLAVMALAVPLIDRLLPGDRHQWARSSAPTPPAQEPIPAGAFALRHRSHP